MKPEAKVSANHSVWRVISNLGLERFRFRLIMRTAGPNETGKMFKILTPKFPMCTVEPYQVATLY